MTFLFQNSKCIYECLIIKKLFRTKQERFIKTIYSMFSLLTVCQILECVIFENLFNTLQFINKFLFKHVDYN